MYFNPNHHGSCDEILTLVLVDLGVRFNPNRCESWNKILTVILVDNGMYLNPNPYRMSYLPYY